MILHLISFNEHHSQDELLWNLYKQNDQDSLIFNSLTSSSYCHTPKIGPILNFVGWAPTRRLPLRKTLMKSWSRYVDWYCVGNSSSMMAHTLWRWLWYVRRLSLAMAWPSHTHTFWETWPSYIKCTCDGFLFFIFFCGFCLAMCYWVLCLVEDERLRFIKFWRFPPSPPPLFVFLFRWHGKTIRQEWVTLSHELALNNQVSNKNVRNDYLKNKIKFDELKWKL